MMVEFKSWPFVAVVPKGISQGIISAEFSLSQLISLAYFPLGSPFKLYPNKLSTIAEYLHFLGQLTILPPDIFANLR